MITVRGGNKSQRHDVLKVAEWTLSKLVSKRLADALEIDIELCNLLKMEDAYGFCCWEDDNIRPREFKIQIDKTQDTIDLIKTAIHELVHVKQYAREELQERYRGGHKLYWKRTDVSHLEYNDLPHEIEAWELQETLYEEYANAN